MKVYACYAVKIYKNKTQNIFKRIGVGGGRRSWIRLLTSPICARNTDLHVGVRFSSVGTRGADGDYFLNFFFKK